MGARYAALLVLTVLPSAGHADSAYANISLAIQYGAPRRILSLPNALRVAGILAAASVAVYGLVKLGRWLIPPSDTQLVEKAQVTYQHAYDRYSAAMAIVSTSTSESDEYALYQVACTLPRQEAVSTYCVALENTVGTLLDYVQQLHRRMRTLAVDMSAHEQSRRLYYQMYNTCGTITYGLDGLYALRTCMQKHMNYFLLFACEACLLARYGQELEMLTRYGNDQTLINLYLHQVVNAYQHECQKQLPYHAYAQRLNTDLARLGSCIRTCAPTYSNRQAAAHLLLEQLSAIEGCIRTSWYFQEEQTHQETVHA